MTPAEHAYSKACCAGLYQSDIARMLLGDTLHPGGLGLTNRMARLMDVQPGGFVLDLASGHGASALAVSRVCRCRVVGVEFGAENAAEAREISLQPPGADGVSFVRGDAECLPVRSEAFDAAICECSMSLFPDKKAAMSEAVRALRPGGGLGLSDVAVSPGTLPEELTGTIGQMLCLTGALDAQGYVDLMGDAGLTVTHREDASHEVLRIVEDVEGKLAFLSGWMAISGGQTAGASILGEAPGLIAMVKELVQSGDLGYWVFVAEKPG